MARLVRKPNYVVEDLRSPSKKLVLRYRRKVVVDKQGRRHILNVAILRKSGPRGGRTRVTSVWHPKGEYRK